MKYIILSVLIELSFVCAGQQQFQKHTDTLGSSSITIVGTATSNFAATKVDTVEGAYMSISWDDLRKPEPPRIDSAQRFSFNNTHIYMRYDGHIATHAFWLLGYLVTKGGAFEYYLDDHFNVIPNRTVVVFVKKSR